MNKILLIQICALSFLHGQSQWLDPSFGNDGYVIEQPENGALFRSVVEDEEHNLVVLSNKSDPSNGYSLFGYHLDGSVNIDFGINGFSEYPMDATPISATSFNIDKVNRILVCGSYYANESISNMSQIFIDRFLQDGSVDLSFGNNGRLIFNIENSYNEHANEILIAEDLSIFIVGWAYNGLFDNVLDANSISGIVMKFGNTGAVMSSFGENGLIKVDAETSLTFREFAIDVQGRIVVLGREFIPLCDGTPDNIVYRFLPNGAIDNSFGDAGGHTTLMSDYTGQWGQDLVILPDGNILFIMNCVQTCFLEENYSIHSILFALNSEGLLADNFTENGVTLGMLLGAHASITEMTLDLQGRIYVSGTIGSSMIWGDVVHNGTDHFVLRLFPNGNLDSTFGVGGLISYDYDPSEYDEFLDVLVLSDNTILTAGRAGERGILAKYFPSEQMTMVESSAKGNEISCFPNPTIGQVTISIPKAMIGFDAAIFNELGKEVLAIGNVNSTSLKVDVSSLRSGFYLIVIGERNVKLIIE